MPKMTMRALDVRVLDSSSVWGSMNSLCADNYSVDISGGARSIGEGYTGCQDYAYIGAGKRAPEEVSVNCLFDDDTGHAYELVRGYYETAPGTIYVRWAPEGSTSGNYAWFTGKAYVTECPPPSGNVENGEPIAFTFSVTGATLTTESVP